MLGHREKDVLYVFFYLIAGLCYLTYRTRGKRLFYGLSLAVFLLSLFSKPTAVTFPAILILIDVFIYRRPVKALILDKIPFLLLSAAFVVVGVHFNDPAAGRGVGLASRMVMAGFTVLFYLSKLVLPVKLSAMYPYKSDLGTLSFPWWSLAMALPLVAAYWLRGKKPGMLLFGVLFFLVAISPVTQIISVSGDTIVADRHTYLASLGIFLIVGDVLSRLYGRGRIARLPVSVLTVVLVVTLVFLSRGRCAVWKNSLDLWNDAIGKYPYLSATAYNDRGIAHYHEREYGQAISDYDAAIAKNPGGADAYSNRGVAYEALHEDAKALADFSKAISLGGNRVMAYINRGNLRGRQADYAKAIADYTEALRLDPQNAQALFRRSTADFQKGDTRAAIDDLTSVIQIDPGLSQAYFNRASVYANIKEYAKAIADYTKVVELSPGNGEAYHNRGMAYSYLGNKPRADEDKNRARQLGYVGPAQE